MTSVVGDKSGECHASPHSYLAYKVSVQTHIRIKIQSIGHISQPNAISVKPAL